MGRDNGGEIGGEGWYEKEDLTQSPRPLRDDGKKVVMDMKEIVLHLYSILNRDPLNFHILQM